MKSLKLAGYIPAALASLVAVLGIFADTAQAADANLNMVFTTTSAGGSYGNSHVHVVWIKDASGNFVYTAGSTTTDTKRALWANSRAYALSEWYSSNPSANRSADIAARTGATQTAYQTYNLNWNWRKKDGTVVPDGTYQIHFLCTNSDSGTPRNKFTRTITKGATAWSIGPVTEGGYTNVSLIYTPAGLGINATAATNVTSLSATLNGEVTATDGVNPTVTVYWGDNDGGTTASSWDHSVSLGTLGVGPFSSDISELAPMTTYYYRCRAVTTSPAKDIWSSSAISFTTPTPDSAQIDLSPATVDFGQVLLNASSDRTVLLRNFGKLPLQVSSLKLVGLENDAFTLVSPPVLPLTLDALPTSWSKQDIGSVGAAGNAVFNGSTITIEGSGVDIWDTLDEFYFVYQTLNGNGQIIARVDSLENTNGYAKAGLMMRNTLSAGSRNAFMGLMVTDGAAFQQRLTDGATTGSVHTNTYAAPYWVKLVRSGTTFSGFASPDGITWTQIGTNQTISMNTTIYIGLAVTSHNDGVLCTGVFSNTSGFQATTPDQEMLTVRFSPTSVQDYNYAKLAIGSNGPDKVAYVGLQGVGGSDAALGTRPVGGIGGNAKALAMYGDKVLMSQGAMLVLLDVSNPAAPSRVNQVRLEGVIEAITVQGNAAYAALGNKGFAVVNLNNFKPLPGTTTLETGGFASDIDSDGSTLCIADGVAGTHVYNISSPLDPVFVKTYATTGAAVAIDISGGLLYVLDESKGVQVFQLNTADFTKTPAVHWELDEKSGLVATDASSNNYNGTLTNMDNSDWVAGKTGNALNFDGVNDYVEVSGYKGIAGTASRTCSAWIKTTSTQQSTIISWGTEQNGQRWVFRTESDGTLAVGVGGGYIKTAAAVNNGQWHHVAAVLNNNDSPTVGEVLLYIDGTLQTATPSNSQAINTVASQNMMVGAVKNAAVPSLFFNGSIDDVRVYDQALAANEIQNIKSQKGYSGVELGVRIGVDQSKVFATDISGNFFILDAAGDITLQSETILQIGSCKDIAVQNGYAYITGETGMEILDISNPAAPVSISVFSNLAGPQGILLDGTVAYVADGTAGLKILDIAAPAAVSPLGSYALASAPSSVIAPDSLENVYVAGNGQNLMNYDLSASAAPVSKDIYGILNQAEDVAIEGQYAFAAAGLSGLQIFDLLNPGAAPNTFATAGFASAVSVNGSAAMVSDSSSVYILDVLSPWAPSLRGSWEPDGWVFDIAAGTTHGYIAKGGLGITILNLSDALPVGSYPIDGIAYAVAADQDILYVASGTAGLTILDVSNPESPSLVSEYDLPGVSVDVAKVGSRICIADATSGISVIDVSNPAMPALYASAQTSAPAFHISSAGSRILVADNKGGLAVLGVTDWPKDLIQGNISGDDRVDLEDLTLLAEQWLYVETELNHAAGNIDYYDTVVNLGDLTVLAVNWQDVIIPPHLIGYWQLNETAGSIASDSTPNGYNGVLTNMDNSDWVAGKVGNALDFDGVDDYVQIAGYKGITGTASRTCMAWIKTTNAQQTIILSWGTELQNGQKWTFRTEPDGTLSVGVWGGNIKTEATVNNGQWRHVAAVLENDGSPTVGEIRLYIDGTLQNAVPNNSQAINTVALQDVVIGAHKNLDVPGSFFKGLIDDVRVYDRALTAQEILNLAQ
ncbi:MAG: hypothetical protein L0Y36_02035 [Planctomycetales bacterium]|nr:hypothetical protein [Planctomycetales bacterium]